MVYIYALNVQDLPDPLVTTDVMEELGDERRQKILRYQTVDSRKQSLGAGLLLNWVLLRMICPVHMPMAFGFLTTKIASPATTST